MEENKNVHRVQTQQFSKRQEKRNKLGCFFDKLTTICMQQSRWMWNRVLGGPPPNFLLRQKNVGGRKFGANFYYYSFRL